MLPRRPALLEWNFHFRIAARSGSIDSSHDPFNVAAQSWPLLIADHYKRDFPAFQVLLVTHILVSRQQKVETCGLSSRYQLAVSKPVPSTFNGFNNDVALEGITKRGRGTVIEEYEHRLRGRAVGQEARRDS